jgi:hypothetical protein
MRKTILRVLALVLAIGTTTACGQTGDKPDETTAPVTNSTTAPAETTTAPQTTAPDDQPLVSKVGDSVTFGIFEGKPVQWTCIDVTIDSTTNQVTKALLLSNDVLFEMPWDSTADITEAKWESSTLREYLGNVWIGATFSQAEINLIITSWITNPGGGTEDAVFILATFEIEQYLPTPESRIAKFAKDGAYDAFDYWTRTPFSNNGDVRAELVRFDGEIFTGDSGYPVAGSYGVRPAIWVDLTAK